MKTKLIIFGGCVSLLLAGCATPQGGTAEETTPAEFSTESHEGTEPKPMNIPDSPSGQNPRDMRDAQSLTIPWPPTRVPK